MIINIKVKTNSTFRKISYNHNEKSALIYTNKSPKENKANLDVINIISDYFNVSRSKVLIKSGLKSKNKIVQIDNPIIPDSSNSD